MSVAGVMLRAMGEILWPFRSTEMLNSGAMTEHHVRTRYRQLFPSIYVPRDAEVSATQRAHGAWLWTGRGGVIAGIAASSVHGAKWVDAGTIVDLIHRHHKTAAGLRIHRDVLMDNEIAYVKGLAVTSPARTAFDLGRWLPLSAAVERIDALMAATGVATAEVVAVMDRHKGVRGLARLADTLSLVDGGSESPQETRTRLLLVRSGFPPPQTQIQVFDRYGDFIARIDMGWEDAKVGVEFDGAQHWLDARQRSRDIDRASELAAEGWVIVRVSADMLRHRAGTVVARVDEALRNAARPTTSASLTRTSSQISA
ncbi:DUF559 domain-containing protein [Mycobacteroides salmoniphilum]|uniref:endonuclease domain-containing protein n=1 Tax=Mycobacteroides salmoniphilum TaxID=404941 RepID=UPI00099194D5|nr:DUF559 domain-containing protein [Mycobacteroides salmoniphilum]